MDDTSHFNPRKSAERKARDERLASALRENLHRRKEQARAQRQAGAPQSKQRAGRDEPPA
jgi:hypothetical protein